MILLEIWIDNNLTRIVGEYEFFDELQYQINCFIESDEKNHRYYSAHTAIAVLMYRYGDDIIVEESEIDYDEIFGEHQKKNGGRFS